MAQVTVWNEFRHERDSEVVADVYPDGIHAVIADALSRRWLRDANRDAR
jgi:Trehalose utilization protein